MWLRLSEYYPDSLRILLVDRSIIQEGYPTYPWQIWWSFYPSATFVIFRANSLLKLLVLDLAFQLLLTGRTSSCASITGPNNRTNDLHHAHIRSFHHVHFQASAAPDNKVPRCRYITSISLYCKLLPASPNFPKTSRHNETRRSMHQHSCAPPSATFPAHK